MLPSLSMMHLTDAVDQLLGYTTWRDTKTALIMFVDRKDFTAVVGEAQKAMAAYRHYKSGTKVEGETRFRYVMRHPGDADRDILVTLLLFHIPNKTTTS